MLVAMASRPHRERGRRGRKNRSLPGARSGGSGGDGGNNGGAKSPSPARRRDNKGSARPRRRLTAPAANGSAGQARSDGRARPIPAPRRGVGGAERLRARRPRPGAGCGRGKMEPGGAALVRGAAGAGRRGDGPASPGPPGAEVGPGPRAGSARGLEPRPAAVRGKGCGRGAERAFGNRREHLRGNGIFLPGAGSSCGAAGGAAALRNAALPSEGRGRPGVTGHERLKPAGPSGCAVPGPAAARTPRARCAACGGFWGHPRRRARSSGQPVLRHLRCTEALPVPRGNLPCSGLCPAPLVLALGTTDRAWTLCALPSAVSGHGGDASEPPVLQAGQSQLPQPLPIGEVFHPHHEEFSTTGQKKTPPLPTSDFREVHLPWLQATVFPLLRVCFLHTQT